MEKAKSLVQELFQSVGEGDVHGYKHALHVLQHAQNGLKEYLQTKILHTDTQMAILLAALLHDVDDIKVFPASTNFENARKILRSIGFVNEELVISMIALVSFSKNGIRDVYKSSDTFSMIQPYKLFGSKEVKRAIKGVVGTSIPIELWMFIPRDSDRLEALGTIGVARCVDYGIEVSRALFTPKTPRFTDVSNIYRHSLQSWFLQKPIHSTIDYFYSGLITRSFMSSELSYFEEECKKRTQPILDVCLLFGKKGKDFCLEDICSVVAGDPEALSILSARK